MSKLLPGRMKSGALNDSFYLTQCYSINDNSFCCDSFICVLRRLTFSCEIMKLVQSLKVEIKLKLNQILTLPCPVLRSGSEKSKHSRHSFLRKHPSSAVILSLDKLRGIDYQKELHMLEDLDFNNRLVFGAESIRLNRH